MATACGLGWSGKDPEEKVWSGLNRRECPAVWGRLGYWVKKGVEVRIDRQAVCWMRVEGGQRLRRGPTCSEHPQVVRGRVREHS
jgi:hypothetical protein